jgi:hypothetical protein
MAPHFGEGMERALKYSLGSFSCGSSKIAYCQRPDNAKGPKPHILKHPFLFDGDALPIFASLCTRLLTLAREDRVEITASEAAESAPFPARTGDERPHYAKLRREWLLFFRAAPRLAHIAPIFLSLL